MDELLANHKKQHRDLQDRIAQKKKNATKKMRKGVDDECAALERELAEKQRLEVAALNTGADTQPDGDDAPEAVTQQDDLGRSLSNDVDNLHLKEPQGSKSPAFANAFVESTAGRGKKPNRQKARLARRAAEQEAAATEAANEAADMPDQRKVERETMQKELHRRGLVENEVRSDGHCMYAAVADQLKQTQLPLKTNDGLSDYKAVRRDAAAFMDAHSDDFEPFLEEPLATYVPKVRDTAEWGGHLELSALSRAYSIRIQVLQGDGRVETIACPDEPKADIWLAYYRHSFGLGEHYNSLRKKA